MESIYILYVHKSVLHRWKYVYLRITFMSWKVCIHISCFSTWKVCIFESLLNPQISFLQWKVRMSGNFFYVMKSIYIHEHFYPIESMYPRISITLWKVCIHESLSHCGKYVSTNLFHTMESMYPWISFTLWKVCIHKSLSHCGKYVSKNLFHTVESMYPRISFTLWKVCTNDFFFMNMYN